MRLFLLCLSCFIWTNLCAEDRVTLWSQALEAQQNGDLAQAIATYHSLLEQDITAPELHNNLGLAYYQQGELGKAILHFERALQLAPNYEDAAHHLAAAQQRIVTPIEATTPIALVQTWQQTYRLLSPLGWAFVLLLLLAAAAGLVIRALLEGTLSQFPTGIRWSIGLGLLAVLPLLLGHVRHAEATDQSRAVVTAPQVGLREYPELSSPELDFISEGNALRIVDQRRDWVQVALPNYTVGWIPASLVERI